MRALVKDIDKPSGEAVRILYGGSLKPENARNCSASPTSTVRSSAAPASIPSRSRASSSSRTGSSPAGHDAHPRRWRPRCRRCTRI